MKSVSRLLLLLGSCAVGLLLCELLVRAFDLGPEIAVVSSETLQLSTHPGLPYELKPGAEDRGLTFNADGMRDRDYPVAKPPGTLRVAVIGDSIAYGYRVERRQAFPRVLESLLQGYFGGAGTDFEVLNFGVVGYSIPEIVATLPAKALKYDPDLVIYGYCLNDPELYNPFAKQLRAQLGSGERSYLNSLAAGRSRLYALARYAIDSRRGRELTEEEKDAIWTDDPGYQAWKTRSYQDYLLGMYASQVSWAPVTEALDRLGTIAAREKIPTLVAVFPLLRGLGSYRLGPVHEQLASALEERSLGVLDLTEVFVATSPNLGQNRPMSVDHVHPTPAGHRVVALALLYWMLDRSLVPGAGREDFKRLFEDSPRARAVYQALSHAGSNAPRRTASR